MSEDKEYADHPVGINELRAARDHDATAWTPRDALIFMLRGIDEGKVDPTELVILYSFEQDGGIAFSHASATKGVLSRMGLIEMAKLDLFETNRRLTRS